MRSLRNTIAVVAASAALLLPAAGLAQYEQPTRTPTISPPTGSPTTSPTGTPTILPSRIERPPLGVTGADILGLTAIGAGSIAVGTGLTLRARRRRARG